LRSCIPFLEAIGTLSIDKPNDLSIEDERNADFVHLIVHALDAYLMRIVSRLKMKIKAKLISYRPHCSRVCGLQTKHLIISKSSCPPRVIHW
jgi:hypothetical protein